MPENPAAQGPPLCSACPMTGLADTCRALSRAWGGTGTLLPQCSAHTCSAAQSWRPHPFPELQAPLGEKPRGIQEMRCPRGGQ